MQSLSIHDIYSFTLSIVMAVQQHFWYCTKHYIAIVTQHAIRLIGERKGGGEAPIYGMRKSHKANHKSAGAKSKRDCPASNDIKRIYDLWRFGNMSPRENAFRQQATWMRVQYSWQIATGTLQWGLSVGGKWGVLFSLFFFKAAN